MGAYAGPRTADQSELALFWAGNTPLFWIRAAAQLSAARHLRLADNAHLFALLRSGFSSFSDSVFRPFPRSIPNG